MAGVQLLVLGPEGVGKTLMLKRLQTVTAQQNLSYAQRIQELGETPPTIRTVGVNLETITYNKKKYTLRELGGVMGPIWTNYFKDASHLIYVVDLGNRTQVASSCIQLLEILSSKETQRMSVLLIFNKIDLPDCMSMSEVRSFMRLGEILANAAQNITVLECSCSNGKGLDGILGWLQEKCAPSSVDK